MSLSQDAGPWRVVAREWRQQWRVGAAATMGAGVAFSVWPSVSSLFVAPLEEAFGWTRGEIALAQYAALLGAFASPFLGRLVDRIGVKVVLLCGAVLTGICYLLLASMNGSLGMFYLFYGLLSVIGLTTTGLTFTRVVAGAFSASRGFALAVTRSGLAIAGALLPSLVFLIISRYGWQAGYAFMAALVLLITLPCAWFWITPAAVEAGAAKSTTTPAQRPQAWMTLLRNHKVLVICFAAAMTYAPIVAVLSQLHPLLIGKGISAVNAASAIGLMGVSAFIGALLAGTLVDRIWAPLIACVFTLGPALSCLLLLPEALDSNTVILAIVLLGLGQGAEIDLVAFMIARYFGLRSYASIYGISVLFIGTFFAFGAALIGHSYDVFGNYDVALMCACACFVVAALSYLAMGRYPAAETEEISPPQPDPVGPVTGNKGYV